MPDFSSTAKRASVFLVLGIGLLLRLGFLAAADEPAFVRVVPDDAYYYFKVARNIVAGRGPTFDAIHPTNGYHPLWMATLLPVAALVRDPHLFVRVALGLGVALSLATALLLHSLVRRLSEDGVGGSERSDLHAARGMRHAAGSWWLPLLALILYWLNPRAVVSSLNGLETSLSTLLFILLLWLAIHASRGTRHAALHPVALGLLMGALFLARTDNLFFIAAFWLAAVASADRADRLRHAAVMAAGAAALAVPWVVYNWVMFGSPVQVSGLSIPYVHHALYDPAAHKGLSPALYGLKRFAVMLYEGLRGEIGYSRLISFPALAASLLIFTRWWRSEAAMPRATRRAVLVLLGLGLASFAHLFVHSAIRWYPRPWYFDQLLVLLPVVFALALSVLARGAGIPDSKSQIPDPRTPSTEHRTPSSLSNPQSAIRNPRCLRILLPLALAGLAAGQAWQCFEKLREGEWPWAAEMLDSARWLRHNTGKDDVAAAFNAGIIGYYSDRRVVNLDGATNNAAYEALRRRDLMGLMRRANVSHYLDFEPMMLNLFRPFLGPLAEQVRVRPLPRPKRPWVGWENFHIQVFALEWPHEGT